MSKAQAAEIRAMDDKLEKQKEATDLAAKEHKQRLRDFKEWQDEQEKAEKDNERLAKQKKDRELQDHKQQLKQAEELTKKQNPAVGLAMDLKKIDDLRMKGLIDGDSYLKARDEAITKASEEAGKNTAATPATITKGSVEEYKQQYSREKQAVDRQLQIMAKQEILAKSQLDETKKIVRHFDEQQSVVEAAR